jgi:hypothetical protein
MKLSLLFIMLTLVLILMVGCAAGPNKLVDTPDEEGTVAGFWMGLWHGAIHPVTFVISLFNDNVTIYAVHNNGGWYNFGFLFAISAVWGSGGIAGSKRRSGKND